MPSLPPPLSALPQPPSPQPKTHRLPSPPAKPPTPKDITVEPITPTTLPAYRRLTTLLLPIRYPDKFYNETLSHPAASSLALCALYHDPDPPPTNPPPPPPPQLVAAIQCRLLDPSAPASPSPNRTSDASPSALYISTLCTLAPHRRRGLATLLLHTVIQTLLIHYAHVTSMYAHVWEANEDALEWYRARGFTVGERVEGYYRRLKPQGARVVRRKVGGVGDWLGWGVAGEWGGGGKVRIGADGDDEADGGRGKGG